MQWSWQGFGGPEERCCGNCSYWMRLSAYEGHCLSDHRLSGSLDITEIRYVCPAWSPVLQGWPDPTGLSCSVRSICSIRLI